ncbi:efflux RND transporter periplasmic adaptor subunit [Marinobacterium jannaschii]|uniref:efflux RND transporter periplasmic adaptor subunit n=1 Tax=Marinobacterium jannaschii TaxID=64970 RepID=UPI000A8C3969|nr:efflux RND transporter periplasmic adaptor subunit [Marinobacterium jannaschii]
MQAADGAPQGLPAEVVHVQSQTLDKRISVVGNLRANESLKLSAEQSGRIETILFQEGQQVKAGKPLFQLDKAIYAAEMRQAQARVKLSQIAYDRATNLLQKRVGSEQSRDQAFAELEVDRAQLALASTRLEKMTVKAPFSGITGLRLVSPGDYVNPGQELVELTDISSLKVDFRVPEIYLQTLKPGSQIEVEIDAFPGQRFQGEVYAIAPGSDSRAHNIQVRARIKNTDGALRPGLFAKVELIASRDKTALMIPEQAIIPQDSGFFVLRMKEDKTVEMAPVVLGQRRPGIVQISSGLNPGDVIVTAGQLKLFPGMPITPIYVDGSQPKLAKEN